MADAVPPRKILLCGDVGGSLNALYKRFETARAPARTPPPRTPLREGCSAISPVCPLQLHAMPQPAAQRYHAAAAALTLKRLRAPLHRA